MLDCTHISSADFTTAKGFKGMITDFKSRNQPIIFYNTHSSVLDTFLGVHVEDFTVVHSLEELHNHLHGKFTTTLSKFDVNKIIYLLIGNILQWSDYDFVLVLICNASDSEEGQGLRNVSDRRSNDHINVPGDDTTHDNSISIVSSLHSPVNGTTS